MGSYAKVENGLVTQVIKADQDFIDSGVVGHGWIQTSYNTRGGVYYIPDTNPPQPDPDQSKALRANYAGIGYTYDEVNDVFYAPRPLDMYGNPCNSWTVGPTTWEWQPPNPPGPAPDDGNFYGWDEATQSWVLIPA